MATKKSKKQSKAPAAPPAPAAPAPEKKPSPFWKPNLVGDFTEGKFLCFQETKVEENGKTKVGAAVVLDSGVLVGLSWSIIHSEFRDIAPTLKPGTPLRFEYAGKGGRSKTIRTWVKGKEMKISGGFETIPADKIGSFFTA